MEDISFDSREAASNRHPMSKSQNLSDPKQWWVSSDRPEAYLRAEVLMQVHVLCTTTLELNAGRHMSVVTYD